MADGILPESIPQNLHQASAEELKAYEEERRLFLCRSNKGKGPSDTFYDQQTQYILFRVSWEIFRDRRRQKNLMPVESRISRTFKQARPYAAVAGIRQTKASEELYFRLKEELGTGVIVEHKKYGEGVVTQLDDRLVHIMFQDDTLRMMDLKILANAGLLKVKK